MADACLLLVELEQQGVVVERLLEALGDKVPKVPAAALDILTRAVRYARLVGVVCVPGVCALFVCVHARGARARARQCGWARSRGRRAC